jgi:hypothetical protein
MGHEHGEAFPREETRDLLGEALRAQTRRGWMQDLAIALALALLALGCPTERLVTGMPPLDSERASFVTSALCFALGWLVLARSARTNGWESGTVLRASLAAATLPFVLLAATTPSRAALGWLGSCLAFALCTVELGVWIQVAGWIAALPLVYLSRTGRFASPFETFPYLGWPFAVLPAPFAWLGILELERRGRRTGWILGVAALAGVAWLAWARASDPEREWRAAAEEELEPTDIVLTGSPAHRYLLERRYGLRVVLLGTAGDFFEPADLDAQREAGRRIVLDASSTLRLDQATRAWAERAATTRLSAR